MKQTIVGCARCWGDGHKDLEFEKLEHPMETDEATYTYWAMCPTVLQPIMLAFLPNE